MLRLKRESFASRIGFLMVSAGCAIGIGNVWRFPTVTGQYGGGVFALPQEVKYSSFALQPSVRATAARAQPTVRWNPKAASGTCTAGPA